MPGHAVVAEISQRMAEGGQLPIQHGNDARLGGVEHQVVEPVVAVHDADHFFVARHGRDVLRQPGHQGVHFRNRLGDRSNILPAPAADLALKIVACLAIAGQPVFRKFDLVQRSDDAIHLGVDGLPLGWAHAGQRLVPQNTAGHELHDVEGAADHGFVFAQAVHARHRHIGALQAAHHRKLALNGMGRGQQFGHRPRFGAHHIGAGWPAELVGWVGLAAFEGFNCQRTCEARQFGLQPSAQGFGVKCLLGWYRPGAYKVVKVVHGQVALAGCALPGLLSGRLR